MARILLVDDDKELMSIFSEYLSAFGFQFELAENAAEARSRLEQNQFDLVLSDFNMPGESGLDLLKHISSHYPELPFIMMSGSGYSGLKTQAMAMGSTEFISKPFEFRKIVELLEKTLG